MRCAAQICWAFNKLWNNKFYYKVASCKLFLLSHWTDFHEIWYFSIFRNLIEKVDVFECNRDKNNGYFTWKPMCTVLISRWFVLNTLRTGDADLRFYVTTVQDGWRKFAFLTRWNSVHLQVLLSTTSQGIMFPGVSHPQALLGSLVSISWKFQFTKIVSEFVINF